MTALSHTTRPSGASDRERLGEALAYFRADPHQNGPVILTPSKMRTHLAVIEADLAAERTAKEAAETKHADYIIDLEHKITRAEADRDRLAGQVAALRTAGTGRAEAKELMRLLGEAEPTVGRQGNDIILQCPNGTITDEIYDAIERACYGRALPTQTAGGAPDPAFPPARGRGDQTTSDQKGDDR